MTAPRAFDALPEELRREGWFVLYKNDSRNANGEGKPRKVPFDAKVPTRHAKSNDPTTWSDFPTVEQALREYPGCFTGIQMVAAAPFVAADIDKCIDDDDNISEKAQTIMASLPESYWERSPSGRGLRGIFRTDREFTNIQGDGFEVFAREHFASLTGRALNGVTAVAHATAAQFEKLRPKTKARKVKANGEAAPIPQGARHHELVAMAGAMRRHGMAQETIEEALLRTNAARCQPPLPEREVQRIVRSIRKYEAAGNLLTQPWADVGNAQRFLLTHGPNVRYVAAFERWTAWDGQRWPVEEREEDPVRLLAHETAEAFILQAAEADGEEETLKKMRQFAGSLLNSSRLTNMLREAQPKATVKIADLDRDPWLVNFKNGSVDVSTGKLREHRREDFATHLIPHNYNPQAKCPQFLKFLDEVFGRPLVEFVHRALGYSLTGSTREKCLFLLLGPTDCGKTTFLNIVGTLLASYTGQVKIESLMVERGRPMDGNAQSDIADLRGKRFVKTSETEEGQTVRESLLKVLTQGQGEFRAVRKYENPFSFPETWKIWLDANHRPGIRGTDDAIWNRLVPIPVLGIPVPPEKMNRELAARLASDEAEGILAWMVRGATTWHRKGLRLPKQIAKHRENWRGDVDELGRWLAERTVKDDQSQIEGQKLYADYRYWRATNGLFEVSATMFGIKLQERGFERKKTGRGTLYKGLKLVPPPMKGQPKETEKS